MAALATFKDVSLRIIYCEGYLAKHSRIAVFTAIVLKLHLLALPVLLALTVLSLPSSISNVANRFTRLFNGCNLSQNHAFLLLNSIIAAIVATSKMNRPEPAGELIQTVAANGPETQIKSSESKPKEARLEFGIEGQEQLAISNCRHDPEDGLARGDSPRQDKATEGVRHKSINPTKPEPPIPQQAAAGDSMEEIWRAISRNSSDHRRSHANNQAVRRLPTLRRLSRLPNSFSRCENERGEVPDPTSRSLGREPSRGLEELNRKSEEFIARFIEQIRLERQESMIRYMRTADTAICS